MTTIRHTSIHKSKSLDACAVIINFHLIPRYNDFRLFT